MAPAHPIRRLRDELRRDQRLWEIVLEPWAAEETAHVLQAVLGEPPSPSLTQAVHTRTLGVSFVVVELAAGLQPGDGADPPLPESVRDAVRAIAAGLSDEARTLLEVGAAVGERFGIESVLALTGVTRWPE